VPLSFQSRPVGDTTVVECGGRIVEGAESARLQRHLNDLLPVHPYILLHLGASTSSTAAALVCLCDSSRGCRTHEAT
jgi:hypothetical protein